MRMLLSLGRRFITVCAFGLWLGGFTLYTAFVIPVGHRQLSSGRFGYVTGEVTSLLNRVAVVAALLLLVNLLADWRRLGRLLRWGTAGTWLLLAATTVALLVLHRHLDALLDYAHREIASRERFEPLHERYEMVSTIQWGAGLLHLWCVLAGWRRSDATAGSPGVKAPGN
jgi:hypothetical protein